METSGDLSVNRMLDDYILDPSAVINDYIEFFPDLLVGAGMYSCNLVGS